VRAHLRRHQATVPGQTVLGLEPAERRELARRDE